MTTMSTEGAERPSQDDPASLVQWYQGHRRDFIEDWFYVEDRNRPGVLLPMHMNRVQQDYWNKPIEQKRRQVFVKARQITISSIIEADYTSLCMLNPGVKVQVVVQKPEEKTIPHHLPRVKTYYHSVPDILRVQLVTSNESSLVFGFGGKDDDPDMTSRIDYVSAGSVAATRGGTYHLVHVTEFDSYEHTEAESLLKALMGLPLSSRIIIESSPQRAGGPLHKMWKSCKDGTGIYTPVLYPWFWEDNYRLPPGSLRVPEPWRDEFDPTEYEASLMLREGLDLDQVRWRRMKVLEADWAGTEAEQVFLSEYLEDDQRCWALSGRPAMPIAYLDRLLALAKTPMPYSQMPDRQDYGGRLRMWLPPEPGETYCIMADPAEGLGWGHATAAVIRRCSDWAHVATFRGQATPTDLGGILVELGRLYNNCLIGWERNNHGHAVEVKVIDGLQYPYVYRQWKRESREGDDRYGFLTGWMSKADLIDLANQAMRMEEWHSWDSELIGQYRELQDMGGNRYDTGELDIAMADLLTIAARPQAQLISSKPKPPVTHNVPKWMRRKNVMKWT